MKILITAGPTQEPIDSVSYLSNYSSGKMGYALAEAARKAGHHVILVSGPTALPPPRKVRVIKVTTALEMRRAVMQYSQASDVIFKVAAVADYRPVRQIRGKMKKGKKNLSLKLTLNPDILKELGKKKKRHQILVGFAAESGQKISEAKRKLRQKNCDWIIFNDISSRGVGFGSDANRVTLFGRQGQVIPLKQASKKTLATQILKHMGMGIPSLRARRAKQSRR